MVRTGSRDAKEKASRGRVLRRVMKQGLGVVASGLDPVEKEVGRRRAAQTDAMRQEAQRRLSHPQAPGKAEEIAGLAPDRAAGGERHDPKTCAVAGETQPVAD